MSSIDPVDEAFARLRADDALPAPDEELEARLVEMMRARAPRRRRTLPVVLTFVGLSGVALAAGGADALRRWWYEVEVDGGVASGAVVGDGERVIPFVTDDGDMGSVRIRREHGEDGADRTRIEIDRYGLGEHDVEVAQHVDGGPGPERFTRDVLVDATSLYAGRTTSGLAFQLFAVEAKGRTRLLVLREDDSPRPVVELAEVPLDVVTVRRGTHVAADDGEGVVVTIDDGRGYELELSWRGDRDALGSGEIPDLVTPDGAIRVRVEPDSDAR